MAQDKIVVIVPDRKDAERVARAIGKAYNWSTLMPYIDSLPNDGVNGKSSAVKVSCTARLHDELIGFAKGVLYIEEVIS